MTRLDRWRGGHTHSVARVHSLSHESAGLNEVYVKSDECLRVCNFCLDQGNGLDCALPSSCSRVRARQEDGLAERRGEERREGERKESRSRLAMAPSPGLPDQVWWDMTERQPNYNSYE